MPVKPIVLIILDGWGYRATSEHNAIAKAKKPVWDKLTKECLQTTLSASGPDVGLPENQMGNSEVGHLTIGAGRVVLQDLPRISLAIKDGSFNQNPVLLEAFDAVSATHTLHIMGLLSKGGVHSHEEHIFAAIRLAVERNVKSIAIHVFLDGRDTPPQSAIESLNALQTLCRSLSNQKTSVRVASLSGRYYAMDRDNRWDRTQKVYELLTEGKSDWFFTTPKEALIAAYSRGETDEFVKPSIITPTLLINPNDTVLFMNFRADRARQLTRALTDPKFNDFPRHSWPKINCVTLTEYAAGLNASIVFPPLMVPNTLGEFLQNHHLKQLRIAETEKYAHITFFLNGGQEEAFKDEDRVLIPSLKIATYDLKPEMSAREITDALINNLEKNKYDLIILNYANADMVGHTGNFEASLKAIETLDECLGRALGAIRSCGGEALITADHGNAEILFDETTLQPHTAHTTEPVPLIYVGRKATLAKSQGNLADIAPTIISLLGLPIPTEMTGKPLIKLDEIGSKRD